MLWEASSTVAPRSWRKRSSRAAHPVGGVGIERGGRLVEQQDFRAIDQRLGERDAGLLSGRQLAGRTVEELRQVELVGERGDALAQILDGVEPAEHLRFCRTVSRCGMSI